MEELLTKWKEFQAYVKENPHKTVTYPSGHQLAERIKVDFPSFMEWIAQGEKL